MPIYRSPQERASETVTFRLTIDEKACLEHLARLQGTTLTDLFRGLISRRAREMGVVQIPSPPSRRGPGRPPKRLVPVSPPADVPISRPPGPDRSAAPLPMEPILLSDPGGVDEPAVPQIEDLIDLFTEHMSGRASGIRKDIAEAVAFVTSGSPDAPPILPADLPLSELDDELLAAIRESVKTADLRFPKKNLYLHYLRMMFRFAAGRPELAGRIASDEILPPLTAREVADAWPAPTVEPTPR